MHITHTNKESLSGSCVLDSQSGFSLLELTVPLNLPHTKQSEALGLVYNELLLSGCGMYTKDTFIDALTLLGTVISVSVENEKVHFSLRARNENLKKTLYLFTTLFTHPTFDGKELIRVKKYLTSNLILSKEDAVSRAYDAFVNSVVTQADRRYSFDIDSIIKEVENVTVGEIKKLHQTLLTRTWVYTCGGNESATRAIKKTLFRLKAPYQSSAEREEILSVVPVKASRVSLINIPHKQNIEFTIGNALPLTRESSDYSALYFGMAVLAIPGGFTGRLMSTVREKEGLTYMIYGQLESISVSEAGYFKIGTFFSPKDAVHGITSTIREISTLHKNGITDDELRRFKAILKTRFALVHDSLIKKVREVHSHTNAGLSNESYEVFQAKIQNLTVQDVNTAIRKYLNPRALVISGAGPIQSVKKELEKFGK